MLTVMIKYTNITRRSRYTIYLKLVRTSPIPKFRCDVKAAMFDSPRKNRGIGSQRPLPLGVKSVWFRYVSCAAESFVKCLWYSFNIAIERKNDISLCAINIAIVTNIITIWIILLSTIVRLVASELRLWVSENKYSITSNFARQLGYSMREKLHGVLSFTI